MNPYLRLAAPVLTALSLLAVSLAARADGARTAPFRYYSVGDGLSQSEVYGLAQDDAGYLWFTTARGLNRFDGRVFEHLTIADGLPTNDLIAVASAPNNRLWVGDGRGGVTLLRGGRVVQTWKLPDELRAEITDLLVVENGVIAVAEGLGIMRVDVTAVHSELLTAADFSPSRFATAGDDIWVVGESGLHRLELPSLSVTREMPEIRAAVGLGDTLWTADRRGRIGVWRDGEFLEHATITVRDEIHDIVVAGETLWVAGDNEIHKVELRSSDTASSAEAVFARHRFADITRLFVDREQTLWLASESGLVRALGDRFSHYPLRTGSDPAVVWGIAEDRPARYWFATQRGLLRKENDQLDVIGPENGVPLGRARDVVTTDAAVWVGIREEGVYRVDPDSGDGALVEGTEKLDVLDLDVATDGALWFGTMGSGVFRYSDSEQTLERFEVPDNTSVFALTAGGDGSIWFGADAVGLVRLQRALPGDAEQTVYAAEAGIRRELFNQIHWVSGDEVWVAMEEGAVYRFDGTRFEDLGAERPFADQSMYIAQPLPNGSIIVGGEQGLYQFRENGRTAHYGQLSGFLGLELSVHATYVDSEGFLWLGTIDGASRMDVEKPMPPNPKLTPEIVRLQTLIGGDEVENRATVAAEQRGVRIEFAAVSLSSPQHLEFSYKLSGLDNGWSAATSSRSVTYSNIPPGSYEFRVRARFPGDEWHEAAVSRRFAMQPYVWQRTPVQAAAVVAILFGIAALLANRTRAVRHANETLRIQVVERTTSIQKAKEKLQQSNDQLMREIEERRKSDQARAELETRFRRAFENAPIGMGLLDGEAQLFDANPALRRMLWPSLEKAPTANFVGTLQEDDRERFMTLFAESMKSETAHVDGEFACIASSGDVLNIRVNLSTVQTESGEYLYSVLQVLDVTESLKLTGRLEYQAMYDELTGLLNRRAFEAELERAWEHASNGHAVSFLMYMDLDQFKVVNDTSGHAAGDALLKRVSRILIDSVRANDSVGRLGGDEFGVILWKCPADVAKRIAESIRSSVEMLRFQWDEETYRIGVSIGGVRIDHRSGEAGELQQLADAACYTAKEEGRNRVHIVVDDQDSVRMHRGQVRWVQRLREAMDNDRFAIYGQLIRPLENTDEPESYEVLLRLRDPQTRKLIPPGAFLPAAERYGFSLELDQWVVKKLMKALFVYQSFQANSCRYWINLSASSISDERFVAFIKEEVARSQLPPGTVNFEITERAVIRNISDAGKLMSELRDMGCRFALDDVGSGLSSFGYLKKLPIDYLKIDGLLVREILGDKTDRIIVKSIIDVAHTLNIKTVCDRIEDEEMLRAVQELGTDYAQGFAIAEPFVLSPNFPSDAASAPDNNTMRKHAG